MEPTPPPPPQLLQVAAELLWITLAMVGGIARALDRYLHGGVFPGIGMLFAHAAVSGFSGYMMAQVLLRLAPEWALIGAGIGGYLGTQGLDWVMLIIQERFGGKKPDGDDLK